MRKGRFTEEQIIAIIREYESGAKVGELCRRESDRVLVPLRPGNAGGGKDPDFWCAFDDGEDR